MLLKSIALAIGKSKRFAPLLFPTLLSSNRWQFFSYRFSYAAVSRAACVLSPKILPLQAAFFGLRVLFLPIPPYARLPGIHILSRLSLGLSLTSESLHTALPPFLPQMPDVLSSLLLHIASHYISLPVSSLDDSLPACSSWYGYVSSVWLSRSTHGSPLSPFPGIPAPPDAPAVPAPVIGKAADHSHCSCNSGLILLHPLFPHLHSDCFYRFQNRQTVPQPFIPQAVP